MWAIAADVEGKEFVNIQQFGQITGLFGPLLREETHSHPCVLDEIRELLTERYNTCARAWVEQQFVLLTVAMPTRAGGSMGLCAEAKPTDVSWVARRARSSSA
jgi:hypothetical protein